MKKHNPSPPRFSLWLFQKTLQAKDYDYALGDLIETYGYMLIENGDHKARRWFRREVWKSLPGFLKNSLYWKIAMFKNYLKITLRNIRSQKGYSFINIVGLSIGIAIFLLISSYVKNELSFDTFHADLDRIYQVGSAENNGSPVPMAPLLMQNIPEIQQTVRMRNNFHSSLFRYKGGFTNLEESYFVDQEIFEVFTFPVIKGQVETALKEPFSLVLTESSAQRIFGSEEPLGKVVNYDNRQDFTVTAVVKDVPENSSISFDALFSIEALDDITNESVSWGHWSTQTYLLFPEDHESKALEGKIREFLHGLYKDQWGLSQERIDTMAFSLRPFRDHYFDKHRGGRYRHGSLQNVYIFTFMAFIILVIAGINFVNLTTARAGVRANEVGVRKVLGSYKSQLMKQFLFESILMSLSAAGIAVLLVILFKPQFYTLIGKELEFELFSRASHFGLIFLGAVGLGVLSGIYPSLYLTAFKPVDILSGRKVRGVRGASFRKALTVFQFSMSILLIVGTLTVTRQLRYINGLDLGFDKNHLIWMDMNENIRSQVDVFKGKLLANPNITQVAASRFTEPGVPSAWTFRDEEGKVLKCSIFLADSDYLETMGLTLVDGQNFSATLSQPEVGAVLLNESAVQEFGMESPLGKLIGTDRPYVIVGVLKDFYFRSLHTPIEPLAVAYDPSTCNKINIRISSPNVSETLAFIGETWAELSPEHPFVFNFYDESFEQLYLSEKRFQKIFLNFAGLAIFVACLGLFGLASYMAEKRTKEIGIRKVMGASDKGIVLLLSKEFAKWVLVANLVAWPVAWLGMNMWLQNFAYRIHMNVWGLLASGCAALLIAILTISFQALRAAAADPVDSLRYE